MNRRTFISKIPLLGLFPFLQVPKCIDFCNLDQTAPFIVNLWYENLQNESFIAYNIFVDRASKGIWIMSSRAFAEFIPLRLIQDISTYENAVIIELGAKRV